MPPIRPKNAYQRKQQGARSGQPDGNILRLHELVKLPDQAYSAGHPNQTEQESKDPCQEAGKSPTEMAWFMVIVPDWRL